MLRTSIPLVRTLYSALPLEQAALQYLSAKLEPCACSNRYQSTSSAATGSADVQRKAAVNRLLYRSKQRGFLEMDLLVGLWAERNLPSMDDSQLAAMETVLDQENPDLFKWLTGQEEAPQAMQANPAFVDMKQNVEERLAAHRDNAAMSQPGKDWVRGWDDWNRSPGPNAMAAPERKE